MDYHNKEIKHHSNGKTVREVRIRNNKGTKTVTTYKGGKKLSSVKKSISRSHIRSIQSGKFVPGLFKDCMNCRKTRKTK